MHHIRHLRRLHRQQAHHRHPDPALAVQLNSLLSIPPILLPRSSPATIAGHVPNCATYQTNPNHDQHSKFDLAASYTSGALDSPRTPDGAHRIFNFFAGYVRCNHPLVQCASMPTRPHAHASITKSTVHRTRRPRSIPPHSSECQEPSGSQLQRPQRAHRTTTGGHTRAASSTMSSHHVVPPAIRRRFGAPATTPITPKRTSFRWPPFPSRDQLRNESGRTSAATADRLRSRSAASAATTATIQIPDAELNAAYGRTLRRTASAVRREPTPCRLPAPIAPSWPQPATRLPRRANPAQPIPPAPARSPNSIVRLSSTGRVSSYTLRGTHDSLVRQNARSEEETLERIEDDADLQDRIDRGLLVRVPESGGLARQSRAA